MKLYALASTALLLTALASPAHAEIVYANDFDTENGGESAANYDDLTGFDVVDGTVDLVRTGDGFGITCAGGSGGCLDLDGSTNRAGLLFSQANYDFNAGDLVTLNYAISGSQRPGFGNDGYGLGFIFNQLTSGTFSFVTSSGTTDSGSFERFDLTVANAGVEFSKGFTDVTLAFKPLVSGSFFIGISGFSGAPGDSDDDNVGLVLDNLQVSVSAVPEPATWAMMIAGFGMIGSAFRRVRGRRMIGASA